MKRNWFLCNFGVGGGVPLLPATFNFTALPDGAIPVALVGSGWSIVSSAAKVAVTLGFERVTNGGFTAWTGGVPDNWSVVNNDASNYVVQVGNAVRFVSATTLLRLIQNGVFTVNGWHKITADGTAIVSAGPTVAELTAAFGKVDLVATLEWCDLAESSQHLYFQRSGTNDVTFTNVSVKPVTLSSALMTMDAKTPDALVSAALDLTLTSGQGNNCGVVARLDSATSPLNFILAVYDGLRVRAWKCLNGVYTSIYNTGTNTYKRLNDLAVVCNGTTVQLFYGGVQVGADITVSDAAIVNNTLFGAFAIKSDAKIRRLIVGENGYTVSKKGMFFIGDSKTLASGNTWGEPLLVDMINMVDPFYAEQPIAYGISGATVATMAAYVTTNLASAVGQADIALINLGVNDMDSMPAEATWKANYISIIDQLRAKWPAIEIYLARPWKRDNMADANTLAGWIADIIATYPSGVYVGTDERVWLENGDDGATYTTDGIHYSAAGQTESAAQWYAILTA